MKSSLKLLWLLWFLTSLIAAGFFVYMLLGKVDSSLLMPGPLSDGHHQLADSCESCHTDALGGGEVLQQACIECHGDIRKKPFDSHPPAKFTDPRNADRLEKINALACVSCHSEHKPELTGVNGLTQPRDLCVHCHDDVAKERPSHKDMEFSTCTDSGCHNFHDNRALYTNFLIKHLHEEDTRKPAKAKLLSREFGNSLMDLTSYPHARYPVRQLTMGDADAPKKAMKYEATYRGWLETAHAKSGVNCSACHQPLDEKGKPSAWTDFPGTRSCATCHDLESKRFGEGKHGMRLKAGLSPMTPADARLPMKKSAAHNQLTCLTCHATHEFNVVEAAVEACLGCHNDKHSLSYKSSSHYKLWMQSVSGEIPADSGVSCASCHMPRINFDVNDWVSRIMVDHNQSANFSPNSKMIRSSCIKCHGLPFTLDSLADRDLIEQNFNSRPMVHIETMELVEQDQKRRQKQSGGDNGGMFGF